MTPAKTRGEALALLTEYTIKVINGAQIGTFAMTNL